MRWIPFLLLAWIILSVEIGLRSSLPFGQAGVAPSFALILSTYIAMGAPSIQALWAALLLGACVDLASPRMLAEGGDVTILGPNALGFTLSAQFTLVMRGVIFRKNPIAVAFMAMTSSLVCIVLVTALLTFRRLYDPLEFRAGLELWHGLLSSLYTGLIALPLGAALLVLNPLLGFYSSPSRRGIGR